MQDVKWRSLFRSARTANLASCRSQLVVSFRPNSDAISASDRLADLNLLIRVRNSESSKETANASRAVTQPTLLSKKASVIRIAWSYSARRSMFCGTKRKKGLAGERTRQVVKPMDVDRKSTRLNSRHLGISDVLL